MLRLVFSNFKAVHVSADDQLLRICHNKSLSLATYIGGTIEACGTGLYLLTRCSTSSGIIAKR